MSSGSGSSSDDLDYSNPDDFTDSQLFQLLGLNYDSDGEDPYGNYITPQIIRSTSESRIRQFQETGNTKLQEFFEEAEKKLLAEYSQDQGNVSDWGDNDMFNQYHETSEGEEGEGSYENDDTMNEEENGEEEEDEDEDQEGDDVDEINQIADETFDQEEKEEDEDDEESIEGFGVSQPNTVQKNKITNRYNQTEVLDGDHPVMVRNKLGVSSSQEIPISQGTLNPSMRNTKIQVVNINSTYRDNIFPPSTSVSSSTNYTITLSDPLYKVLDMKLLTYTIPYVWYNINTTNNYFYLDATTTNPGISGTPLFPTVPSSDSNTAKIVVPVGHYSTSDLYSAIQQQISNASDANSDGSDSSSSVFSSLRIEPSHTSGASPTGYTGQTRMYIDESESSSATNTSEDTSGNTIYKVRFFEDTMNYSLSKFNNNLGWILGFRGNANQESANYGNMVYEVIDSEGVVSESSVDTEGPRSLTLCVDDFCNTQMSNHVVGTTSADTMVQMPSYWTDAHSLNTDCSNDKKVSFIRDVPRRLTNAQIYTMNSIAESDQTNPPSYSSLSSSRLSTPNYTNALSVIPLELSSLSFGSTLVKEAKTSLPRVYFGPVTIDRLRVKLQDEMGNQVDMNNRDWSFTLQVTSLYQY